MTESGPVYFSDDSKSVQKNPDIEHQAPLVTPNPMYSVASIQIIDIIKFSVASVRLRNCIIRAGDNGDLPVQTIGEYLAGLPYTEQQFLSIQNFWSEMF